MPLPEVVRDPETVEQSGTTGGSNCKKLESKTAATEELKDPENLEK